LTQTASHHPERSPRTGRFVRKRTSAGATPATVATPSRPGAGSDEPPSAKRHRRRRKRVPWVTSVLVAATVGVAGFLVGGFQYRASVDWVVTDAGAPTSVLNDLRRDLLDHTWQTLRSPTVEWRVDLDAAARALRVTTTSPDLEQASTSITQLATTFMERIHKLVEHARTQPGPDELVLTEFRRRLADDLLALTGDVRRIESTVPDEDCQAVDAELRTRLATGHATYAQNRERVREAEVQLAAIHAAPLPQKAAVDPDAREQAIRTDVEVQQDLRALRVQLAETRYQLVAVCEAASSMLDVLTTSAKSLEDLCAGEQVRSTSVELRRPVERIGQSAADYSALLAGFAQAWNQEGDRLRALEDDPRQAKIIDLQATLYNLLSGFVFQSSVPLTSIRDHVRAVSTAPGTPAGRHELASSLVRGLHALQSAHHRFEFTAGDIKPSNNFRLDAALRSAKGLRHRSRGRLEQIEGRLSRDALANLRDERERRVAALSKEIDELRPTLDASVEALLATHEQADRHTPALQRFHESQAVTGVYDERIKNTQREIARIDTLLTDRAAKRMGVINPDHLRVVAHRISRWPVNLPAKLLQATLAFAAVLVFLVGLQMWLSPRVE